MFNRPVGVVSRGLRSALFGVGRRSDARESYFVQGRSTWTGHFAAGYPVISNPIFTLLEKVDAQFLLRNRHCVTRKWLPKTICLRLLHSFWYIHEYRSHDSSAFIRRSHCQLTALIILASSLLLQSKFWMVWHFYSSVYCIFTVGDGR